MSDPRNVAHDKRVTQEKRHHAATVILDDGPAVQPGKKSAVSKDKHAHADASADGDDTAADTSVELSAPSKAPALEGSLIVLSKLKELEFHSRAHLERLAELTMTVDELSQTAIVAPLGEVYAAQNAFQTKLTALIATYKAECDGLTE